MDSFERNTVHNDRQYLTTNDIHAPRPCTISAQNTYRDAQAANDATPELLNALIYRITIKRILARQLELADIATAHVQVRQWKHAMKTKIVLLTSCLQRVFAHVFGRQVLC